MAYIINWCILFLRNNLYAKPISNEQFDLQLHNCV